MDASHHRAGRVVRLERPAEHRRRREAAEALPDLIELVIVGVRAGLTPTAALEMAADHAAAPLVGPLDEVRLRLHRGHRLADALDALPSWLGRHAGYFTDALVTADRYGLPLAPVLDQLSADVRADRSRRAQEAARTLPVKLSFPLVACTLPSFVLLAIAPAVLGAISTLRGSTP